MSTSHGTRESAAGSDHIVGWRRERLLAAGVTPRLAGELAAGSEVDLHAVLELIDSGCPAELAARILAPLEGRGQARS